MVDKTDVIYDDVRFIEPVSRSLAIANTGQVDMQVKIPQRLHVLTQGASELRVHQKAWGVQLCEALASGGAKFRLHYAW